MTPLREGLRSASVSLASTTVAVGFTAMIVFVAMVALALIGVLDAPNLVLVPATP